MEFLDLPQSPKLVESQIEQELIGNLQAFLLEMGKGFAFVARQERLTLDGDHFYIDLVFYHTVLKCYLLRQLLRQSCVNWTSSLGQTSVNLLQLDHLPAPS